MASLMTSMSDDCAKPNVRLNSARMHDQLNILADEFSHGDPKAFVKFAAGAAPKKVIVVPGRLVNVVV